MALFKKKYSLGIDLASSAIKIVEGKFSKKGITINKYFTINLPEKIYKDGEISNIHSMSTILEEALKKNKLSTDKANVVVSSSNIITRLISVPNVGLEEIESMLKYQIDDYIPINPEDYIVQFIGLDNFYEDGVDKLNLLLIGLPKSMVEAHFGLVNNSGLRAESLDAQSNAITKLINTSGSINKSHPIKEKNIASLDIGFYNTKLSLMEDGMTKLSRVIDFGSKNILEAISLSLSLEMNEAQDMLLQVKSFNNQADGKLELVNIIKRELGKLIEQLDRIFRYYITRDAENNIDLLLLHGGINHIEGLNQIFTEILKVPTERLVELEGLNFQGPLWDYANAIGGLIRKGDMKL